MYTFSIISISDNRQYATGMLLAIHPGARDAISYMNSSHIASRHELQRGNTYTLGIQAVAGLLDTGKAYNVLGHWSDFTHTTPPAFEFTITKADLITDTIPEKTTL